jgi:hypothetical protein
MNDMRSNINRATGSAIGMDEMRARFGGSGAISFSDLRNCEGFVITVGSETGKFGTLEGWTDDYIGSISPDEGSGRVQFAANSWLASCYSPNFSNTVTYMSLEPNQTDVTTNGDQVTAGFKVTNLTRVVMANTSRTINSAQSNSTTSLAIMEYDFAPSGTVHCLVKF